MKKVLATGIAGLLLAGCNQTWVWDKPGFTKTSYDMDSAQCLYEAKASTPTSYRGPSLSTGIASDFADAMREAELGTLCMKAKGYYKRTAGAQ